MTRLRNISSDPVRVLVTYGWCRTSYLALRSLARLGYRVSTCSSMTPSMSAWSRFSHENARVADPFSDPERFVADVAELAARWRIEIILPAHEDGIALRRFEHLLPAGVILACPPLAPLELAVDKGRLTELAIESGVPTPRTLFPATVAEALAGADQLGFPLIVKLRRGNSGKGVAAARDVAQLEELLGGRWRGHTASRDRFPMLQELVPGQVVGACFLAREGRVEAVFGERYLRCKDGQFGTSVFREPLYWPRLAEHVRKMAAALTWSGIGHFDFIADEQRQDGVLLELNPRLWGAINLSYVNGFDFPGAVVAMARGELDLARHFDPVAAPGLRSIWLIGEAIVAANRLRGREWLGPLRELGMLLRSLPRSRFDDLVWRDPVALLVEAVCYGRGFLRAGGSTNPVADGMLG